MNKKRISIFDHVYALELSLRATISLENANITSIAELVQYSEQELLSMPNFGCKSLNEIKEALALTRLGLGMRMTSHSTKEHSKFIEKLTSEHKECKLRCQEIEKQVNELLGSHCVEAV